jgi:hypothetical protein
MRKKGLRRMGVGRPGEYEVGYGRPPEQTRFRPGQSGNPNGRPKGTKNVAVMARVALERKVHVVAKGVRKKMTVREVSLRKVADKALAGDQRALAFLFALTREQSPSESAQSDTAVPENQDLEIIKEFLKRQRPKTLKRHDQT